MSAPGGGEPARRGGSEAIDHVIEPAARDLGAFSVRRALPSAVRQRVGPFIFFDEMGPATLGVGKAMDVRPHPHIGIATVTWLFEGEVLHRDSLGVEQSIRPGAVNLMTAGRGVVHSERSPAALVEAVTPLHGIQTWLALPLELEETEPAFAHYPAESIPLVQRDGASIRLIAGSAYGATSPVQTASETFYAAVDLQPGARVELPLDVEERGIYVVAGKVDVDGERFGAGTLVTLRPGVQAAVVSNGAARAMLFGGAALPGERTLWWNFVSSRPERIEQAKADWREGRFEKVPGDAEFIPLPDD